MAALLRALIRERRSLVLQRWMTYLSQEVTPSQWSTFYDQYFTSNKRDEMRLEESKKAKIVDKTVFGQSFRKEAFHAHYVMIKAFKLLKINEFENNKSEIMKRYKEQFDSKKKRSEGFLNAFNIKTAKVSLESETTNKVNNFINQVENKEKVETNNTERRQMGQ